MPLDPNIAMGFKPMQIESPINQMSNVLQLRNAMQSNQLNQLKMQEAQQGLADRQALRGLDPTAPDYAAQLSRVDPMLGAKYSEQKTKSKTAELDFAEKQRDVIKRAATSVVANPTPDFAIRALNYVQQVTGEDMSDEIQMVTQMQSPEQIRQWAMGHAASMDQLIAQMKPKEEKPITVGKGGAIYDPNTKKWITPPAAAGSGEVEPPKLRPGERWRPDTQTVEAVPGSDIFKKQKSDFTKEYKAATSVIDKMEEGVKKLDSLLDPKKAKGFSYNFGGYTEKFAGQFLPGAATDFRKELDSFKSTLKSAGLELIRQGGSIGQMTVQEWPIVEQMIAAISPEMGEEAAKATMNEIRARFDRIASRAREIYDLEYADSQFYTPIKSGGAVSRPASPAGQPMFAVNPQTKQRIMSTDGGATWAPAQ